jgi:hypothetical protein
LPVAGHLCVVLLALAARTADVISSFFVQPCSFPAHRISPTFGVHRLCGFTASSSAPLWQARS